MGHKCPPAGWARQAWSTAALCGHLCSVQPERREHEWEGRPGACGHEGNTLETIIRDHVPPEDASGILEVLDVQKNKCFCLQGTGLVTVLARGGRLPQPGRHPTPGRLRQLLAWDPERRRLLTPPFLSA